jgi:hypothetical protein
MSRCKDDVWLTGIVTGAIKDWMVHAMKLKDPAKLDVSGKFADYQMNWSDFDSLCDDITDVVEHSINKALAAEPCKKFPGVPTGQWRTDRQGKTIAQYIGDVVGEILKSQSPAAGV